MEYRQLGQSGLHISVLGLGSWLTYGSSVQAEDSMRTIQKAYELGINFFDTANVYSGGRAEEILGSALKHYPRSSYVLTTKVFFPMGDGPNDRGLSRKHIMEQCEASLRRLGTEYIDIYFCHRFDPTVPLEETLRALDDLVSQGKILYTGVSEWTTSQMQEAVLIQRQLNLHRLVVDQPRYNMLQRGIEDEILPFCVKEGLGLVVFSPLAQGFLTGKYVAGSPAPQGSRATTEEGKNFIERFTTEKNYKKVDQLQKLAQSLDLPLAHLALAWTLRLSEITSAITGASQPEQLVDNIKAIDIKLEQETINAIDAILKDEND